MIYCYLCPLKDMCPIPKVKSNSVVFGSMMLNWLPDGVEHNCPLYKVIKEGMVNGEKRS